MIDISNTITPSEEQWQAVASGIQGMTGYSDGVNIMKIFAAGGNPCSKFKRMIPVWVTIDASNSFWNCFDSHYKKHITFLPHTDPFGKRSRECRTIMMNYYLLTKIYRNRKLVGDNWRTFRNWIETLPHFELITGVNYEKDILGDTDV